MNVIAKKAILFYKNKYPLAETALLVWLAEITKADFQNYNAIKQIYGNASIVAANRVVFNIRGNHFRLIVSFNFKQSAVYVIWFGTHKEYDRIDVEKVSFDRSILDY